MRSAANPGADEVCSAYDSEGAMSGIHYSVTVGAKTDVLKSQFSRGFEAGCFRGLPSFGLARLGLNGSASTMKFTFNATKSFRMRLSCGSTLPPNDLYIVIRGIPADRASAEML